MVIALPRRKQAVVCRPDRLQGDGIRIFAGSGTELIHLIVILFLQDGIGKRDRRLRPVIRPISLMRTVVRLDAPL